MFCVRSTIQRSVALGLWLIRSEVCLASFSTKSSGMSGRGAYYKNKYGNRGGGGEGGGRGGRGRGRGGGGGGRSASPFPKRGRFDDSSSALPVGGSFTDLERLLESLDGRSYPSYHDLEREWKHHSHATSPEFSLLVGRAQSDPFAPPTRCQVRVPATQFVDAWPDHGVMKTSSIARIAAADFILRHLYETCQTMGADQSLRAGGGGGGSWGGPKGGDIQILAPTQHVLEQSAVQVVCKTDATSEVVLQLTINLPARGRTVLGFAAQEILCQVLPQLVEAVCALPTSPLLRHAQSIQAQVWLQNQLASQRLVAFVPNGAILPRQSGVDDRPLLDAVPFQSPPSMEKTFVLPETQRTIVGMGIPEGVTLICGGGFHGKSTLLQALQWGVYPKVPGDGREFCVTRPRATSIRAEDGRSVQAVNIADFLQDLPGKSKDTSCFSTENASGSTSQASNIVEAIELGAEALLMDEDVCATNFMNRDAKMIQLVAPGKEPITPFVRVVRALHEQLSLSTILVIGGTGDFFDVADHVLVMDAYECHDATDEAKKIVAQFGGSTSPMNVPMRPLGLVSMRHRGISQPGKIQADGKVKVARRGIIAYGNTEIDLTAVEQIVSASQTSSISNAIQKIASFTGGCSLKEALQTIEEAIDQNGLETLAPGQFHGGLSRPRMLEVGAALNRLRVQGAIIQDKN